MQWEVRTRTGKVFIDHNMNRMGANIAAVYSVRPEPGAPVSTPLTWDEVAPDLDPLRFSLGAVPARVSELGDLQAPLLHGRQRLPL